MEGISPTETVTFFLSERELFRRGWRALELTEEQLLTLVREKCAGRIERVEVCVSEAGILLIVCRKPLRPTASRPPRQGRLHRL